MQQRILLSAVMLLLFLALPAVRVSSRQVLSGLGSRSLIAADPVEGLHAKHHKPKFRPGPWKNAHATYYGGPDASGTNGGTCGYEDLSKHGYGVLTAALSPSLFNDGLGCGSCYEINCINDPKWCKPGQPSLFVTGTNLCPSSNDGPSADHFDLSQPAFLQIADQIAGIIPIQYRRVPCKREGGIRFTISGNPYYNKVLVWNVGGAGDVKMVKVKGSKKLGWTTMKRDWGQNWITDAMLVGESLTFRVIAGDGRSSTAWHVAPTNWQFGQTFEGKNFK
ncbi:Expansin [Macleaya cordata]|uniref:Expansin n=1 Tax=Macleaya cordata TaxID=56857 RepID=A0A200R5H0_MACCD|nr:Expansin [Macleaya cordata]